MSGILYVLRTGIAWGDLPQELGFGSGITCWRRLRDWQELDIWQQLHDALLSQMRRAGQLDLSRASIDAASVASPGGPTDRRQPDGPGQARRQEALGCRPARRAADHQRHGANCHDSTALESLVDAMPAVAGCPSWPRKWPAKLHADKGYDYARCRAHLKARGIADRIARRGIESKQRLGRHRWVVERTRVWPAAFGKLRIRFKRRIDIHLSLLTAASCVVCMRMAEKFC